MEPPPRERITEGRAYFRFANVRSDESLATNLASHQLEPKPLPVGGPGLIAVPLPGENAV